MAYRHVSAMMQEAIDSLACRPGAVYVDGTLGGAGHAQAICERIKPDGVLVGIDQDLDAIENAQQVLKPYAANIHLFHGNFIHLPDYLDQIGIGSVNGILLDLGLSQHQIEASGRGFSFQKDEPLDMRMDMRSNDRAQDLVNSLSEDQLSRIFHQYGEERWSRRIARAVVAARRQKPIRTSGQLVNLIQQAVPKRAAAAQRIHPATRAFMALRIAVNQELARLESFLDIALDLLGTGGRLCVLSFHSLEDRLVKQRFKAWSQACTCPPQLPQCVCSGRPAARLITKRVMRPSEAEMAANPMARSTRLRAIEKLAV